MRTFVALGLSATVGIAQAAASATVTVYNRTPTVVVSADGSSRPANGDSATLAAGDRLTYEFDYTLAVHDDGLPFIAQMGPWWDSGGVTIYSGATGHANPAYLPTIRTEFAVANIFFGDAFAGASLGPLADFSGTADYLATIADDMPQSFTRTGHGHATISLSPEWSQGSMLFTLPPLFRHEVALGVGIVADVPEPPPWALLLTIPLLRRFPRHRPA